MGGTFQQQTNAARARFVLHISIVHPSHRILLVWVFPRVAWLLWGEIPFGIKFFNHFDPGPQAELHAQPFERGEHSLGGNGAAFVSLGQSKKSSLSFDFFCFVR